MSDLSFITNAVDEALRKWNLEEAVRSEEIARFIVEGTSYWEMSLPEGTHLALIRLFSPVVRREEIFLGNVLLNDFLNKALIRGVQQSSIGRISLLVNDLENYYYLYFGSNTLEELTNSLRQAVDASLLDLYFADENSDLGVYGHLSRMLDFQLANREPFPIFSIPSTFIPALIDKVADNLSALDSDSLDVQKTIAALGFFFSRGKRKVEKFDKKKGIYIQRSVSEMQSDFAFLMGAVEDGLIPLKLLRDAIVLSEGEELNEQIYRDRKKKEIIDRVKFKELIQLFLCNIRSKISEESSGTVLASLHEKSLDIQIAELVNKLVQGVQIGFIVFQFQADCSAVPCRFCGDDEGLIREKTIIAGTGMTRFFNPAPKMPHPKQAGRRSICIRCGISSYLETKLLGVMFASDMPIPKQYNIIFHYGHHNDAEISYLASLIDDIFGLIKSFRRQVEENKAKVEEITFSLDDIKKELKERAKERQALMEPLSSAEEALDNLLSDEITESGVEVLGQIRSDVDTKIYAMGHSSHRLFIIILPQFEPLVRRRGVGVEIDWNFIPEHFSRSRIAMFTLLAILRKLCGCGGPYYFHSAPRLSQEGINHDTFYIKGNAESADEVIKRYGTIVNFARRLINSGKIAKSGKSSLIEWIILAEKFEADPLGTFSDVLRRTPMKKRDFSKENRDKFGFRPLAKYDTIDEMGVIDGLEYLKLMECLKVIDLEASCGTMIREEMMLKQMDTIDLDNFCQKLFRILDHLGGSGKTRLLPMRLTETPTAFEKYPRMLVGLVQRYGVEAGFKEWESKVLRDASPNRTQSEYSDLLALYKWMQDHKPLFDKTNLNHLKRSFYGRIYTYLYPLRSLVVAYTNAHIGDNAAFDDRAIIIEFQTTVSDEIKKLSKVYPPEMMEQIIEDARRHLLVERHYYRAWKL